MKEAITILKNHEESYMMVIKAHKISANRYKDSEWGRIFLDSVKNNKKNLKELRKAIKILTINI